MGLSYIHRKFFPAYLLNFANSLGTTVLMPILPFIILGNGAPKWVFGLFISLYSIFQFIGSPVLGAMSDRLGRKPVLLISHVGTLLSWFIFLGALYSPKYELWGTMLPLWIIGVSRILDGLTGGNTSVANAYVADITTRKEKLYIFGYIGGITGVAMMLGPGIGGFTASRELGHAGTILTAIFISVITLISIFAWLKESLPVEKRVKANGESILGLFNISKRELRNINNIHALEGSLYSKYLGIAGTVDCIAEYNNELAIIDFKTSKKPKPREWIEHYFVQCMAYGCMLYEITGISVKKLVIIMACENGECVVYEEYNKQKYIKLLNQYIKKFVRDKLRIYGT